MCAPQAPTPPDPKAVAAASTGTNVGTAIANATMGNVNQVTPEGSLNYSQSGTTKWTDPYTGQSYDIPSYTATQTLSPTGQATFDTQQQTKANLAGIGRDQSSRIGALLGTPLDLSSGATEARTMHLARARLDPILADRASSTEADLINRGIRPGSDAYDRAHTVLDQGQNDAYNQLILSGHGQAVGDIMTERNAPINEIDALMSGSQVSQPNYVNTNMPSIPTTDTAGIINANYGQKEQNYQDQMGTYNAVLGGLFGLGAGALKGGYLPKPGIPGLY